MTPLFLDHGADPNLLRSMNGNAIGIAARRDTATSESVSAKHHRCGTLLQAAKEANHNETLQLLRSRGVSEGQAGPSSHL